MNNLSLLINVSICVFILLVLFKFYRKERAYLSVFNSKQFFFLIAIAYVIQNNFFLNSNLYSSLRYRFYDVIFKEIILKGIILKEITVSRKYLSFIKILGKTEKDIKKHVYTT